jgi:dihydropteroate synthase
MSHASVLRCGTRCLDLSRPLVMGVLNVTPDSFSDGGHHTSLSAAVARAAIMIGEGADIIDIGGESTRPGAAAITSSQELDRVMPVIEAVCSRFDVAVSLDSSTPEVMREGVAKGVCLLNDVRGFRRDGAAETAVASGAGLCIMHMQGEPSTMQAAPHYDDDVVTEVAHWLLDRATSLIKAGADAGSILIDPGFGFGKTVEQNYRLLAGLRKLTDGPYPLLAGLSRKSMIGAATGKPVSDRLAGSVAAALIAVQQGARLVRVHDVAATVDALRVYRMTQQPSPPGLIP